MLTDREHQALTRRILEIASAGGDIHPPALANEFQADIAFVEEELVRMARMSLIELSVFDGCRDKPYGEWPDIRSFFNNPTSGHYVKVRLLLEGKLMLSRFPKSPIGFAAVR